MHYCGVVPAGGMLQLAMLEEVRAPEPPIQLSAVFFEPATAAQLAAELRALGDVVVALGGPITDPIAGRDARACDLELQRRGVLPAAPHGALRELAAELAAVGTYSPGAGDGAVAEGAFREGACFETNADGVFCALQGRRLPAKRHPVGMRMRIAELEEDSVLDDGGGLWNRRAEEIDAAGAALCAHRFAVGHASWLGDPAEGVVVLPGAALPDEFTTRGVLPPVERIELPRA